MSGRGLVILGTSGLAREMAQLAAAIDRDNPRWELLGFVSDGSVAPGTAVGPHRVLGDDDWLLESDIRTDIIIGIGHPEARARAITPFLLQRDRFHFPNLIHPAAVLVRADVELGEGNVASAGSVFTCDIEIADFNLFNYNATVGHDGRIGSYGVLNPGCNIGGWVAIGDRVLIGTGAQVLERRSVGDDARVGAGAVVTHDVAAGTTVVGVPARPLSQREE